MICLLQSVVRAGTVVRTRPCWRPTPLQTTLMSACPTSSPPTYLMEFSVIFPSHNKIYLTGVCYLGGAYTGSICRGYDYAELYYGEGPSGYLSLNTGIVTFAGNIHLSAPVVQFAHEVGHNLGAKYDGSGWNDCDPDKYLMSSQISTLSTQPNGHRRTFSNCSKDYFKSEMQRLEEV